MFVFTPKKKCHPHFTFSLHDSESRPHGGTADSTTMVLGFKVLEKTENGMKTHNMNDSKIKQQPLKLSVTRKRVSCSHM